MDEERVKKFIKAYEEIKEQSFIIANINKDFFFEFAECLIKRIKELEEEKKNRVDFQKKYIEVTNLYLNSISKQKIKDKIKELANTKGDLATYIATSERIKVLEELLEEKE